MVEWTDFERATIQDIFAKMDYESVGPAALARCLVVYPWCQRYFGNFGNLYNAAAIKGNPMIAKHGTTILHGLDRAVKNMDNIKETYAELSVLHSEKLHVDPDNFKSLVLGWPPPSDHMLLEGEQGFFKRGIWCRVAQHLLIRTGQSRASKMVEWTDFERATIQDIFAKMDYESVGPAALARCLVVYPWCQRYFGNFGNLYNAE
eukprot:superscaffoldBa00011089_g25046